MREDEYDTMSDGSSDNEDAMPNADSSTDEEYEIDPWWPKKNEAAQRNRNEYTELTQRYVDEGFTNEEAKSKAYSDILPKLRKDLQDIYLDRLF